MQGSRQASSVYVVGSLGYDFISEARRDAFRQQMKSVLRPDGHTVAGNPYDPREMVAHLKKRPSDVSSLTWTLSVEMSPVYVIEPVNADKSGMHAELIKLMEGQVAGEQPDGTGERTAERQEGIIAGLVTAQHQVEEFVFGSATSHDKPEPIERVAVSGELTSQKVKLFSGQVVPVVAVEQPRDLCGWPVTMMVHDAAQGVDVGDDYDITQWRTAFFNRLYDELHNIGQESRDRALNFPATTAMQDRSLVREALVNKVHLDHLSVDESPSRQAEGDCWDVTLSLVDPANPRKAPTVVRYNVDISNRHPVLVATASGPVL